MKEEEIKINETRCFYNSKYYLIVGKYYPTWTKQANKKLTVVIMPLSDNVTEREKTFIHVPAEECKIP